MANWKKVIVSGSNAELAQLSLSDLSAQPSEGTVLTINDLGVIGTKEGAAGTSGSSGSSGTDGTSGSSGTDGTSGSSGTDGTSGSSGSSGSSGTDGTSGSSGSSGTDGTSGSSGSSGTDGTSGSSGTDGTSGSSGTDGTDGTSGSSGTDGTSGSSGTDGTSGSSGTDGTSGSSGSSGTDGTSGSSGSSGTDGTSGSSGSSGSSGTDGTSGSSGTDGTSGSSGSSGTDGTSGSSGSSGSSGLLSLTGTTVDGVITLGATGAPNADVNSNLVFDNTGGSTLGGLLTVTGDVVISHDLTVQGTASFQNSENLLVADRFILLASGSNSTGDGGIVIQQGTQDYGDAFAYDGLSTERWGVTSSFHASGSGFTPDAFMATVVVGSGGALPTSAPARYQQEGNIFTAASGDVYIYS